VVGAGITGVTAAVLLKRGGKRVALLDSKRIVRGASGAGTQARVAVGGVMSPPAHAIAAAKVLVGQPGSPESITAATAKVPEAIESATSDSCASAEYRTHLAQVLGVAHSPELSTGRAD
jgi:CO/xanthine dehydrogenase FAD-binding subunit